MIVRARYVSLRSQLFGAYRVSHHPQPEKINLTGDQFTQLETDINDSSLSDSNKSLIIKSLQFMVWLQKSLLHAKVSIRKLQVLFDVFPRKGKKREKTKDINVDAQNSSCVNATEAEPDAPSVEITTRQTGRIPARNYKDAQQILIEHPDLKHGDPCPTQCGGKLYKLKPSAILKIEGSSFANATCYKITRLRCALCGDIQKPEHRLSNNKYTQGFVSHLILHKYYLALPMYRLDGYQKILGTPLPDSTQWDLINSAYEKLLPVFTALESHAADANQYYYDDTRVRILSVMKDNIDHPNKKRTGQYTSVIIAETKDGSTTLFYSSTSHAGENMQELLSTRSESAGSLITMCDALSANNLNRQDVIESNCLAHALVKFIDLELVSPYDLSRPINDLTEIFKHDELTFNMTPDERLQYHQKNSGPILINLHAWLKQQLDDKITEPNSHLGKVIKYCLKHWHKLTRFLTVAGCPISNNRAERAVKIIIRLRKSSLFHKTEHGAKVAATLLSLIQTAINHEINPIHYIQHLLQNESQIVKEPERYLPWCLDSDFKDKTDDA